MKKASSTGGNLSIVLRLWVLLSCTEYTMPADTHSLNCNFIVKSRTKFGQPWFERQCSVNGVPFLHNDTKATALGNQGKEENAIKECVDLSQKLKDIGEELRNQLLNMEPVAVKTRGHHTLQVTTVSRYKQEQLIDTFWNFTIGEQYSCLYYPMNKTCKVIHDKDTGIMEKWEPNRELVKDLEKFSMGDSSSCLKEFLKHQKEMPRSTLRAPDIITQLTSATQLPSAMDTTQILPNTDTLQQTLNIMSQLEKIFGPIAAVIAIFLPLIGGIFVNLIPKKVLPAAPLPLQSDLQFSSPTVSGDS